MVDWDKWSDASKLAWNNLRNIDDLTWWVVPMLVFVVFIYMNEIEKGNMDRVYGGIIWFCLAGVFLEILNALVLPITNYSPLWLTPEKSTFVIYVGWNFEIALIALLFGIHNTRLMPKDPAKKVLGMPNLIFSAIIGGIISTVIELVLNAAGLLVWEYKWWSWPRIPFIILWWIWPNLLFMWFMWKSKLKTKMWVAFGSVIFAILCHVIFATMLHLV